MPPKKENPIERARAEKEKQMNGPLKSLAISADLEQNKATMKQLFQKDDTLIVRDVQSQYKPSLCYAVTYCGGMVDNALVSDSIIKPLSIGEAHETGDKLFDMVMKRIVFTHNPVVAENFQAVVEAVTYGDTVLFVPGCAKALIMSTQGFPLRSISEPDGESILSGPKEGFCESLIMNLTQIHRRLRTNDLKMEMRTIAVRSRTQICICYLDSLVDHSALQELFDRLTTIEIDGVLDVHYLDELIRDNQWSPFRSTGYTERPDVAVGKILEGRIVVLMDGTPVVLTIPHLFIENFQSNEDYYINFYYSTFNRFLRIMGFILTVTAPAFYLSITTYHHEFLPTALMMNVAQERQNVPFPMVIELIAMLLAFDLLKESGIRVPAGIGQAMSVVGALVLGSAAVEAKIVSSLVIIVVALTGITSLLVPKLNVPTMLIQMFFLLVAAVAGLPGLTVAVSIVVIHILRLKSFGVWQVNVSGEMKYTNIKDVFLRAPLWQMRQRPKVLTGDRKRFDRVGRRWWS